MGQTIYFKDCTVTALKEGITKWKTILNSEASLRFGTQRCGLCELFNQQTVQKEGKPCSIALECKNCPLEFEGFGCVNKMDSNWRAYWDIVRTHDIDFSYLKNIKDSSLRAKLRFHIRLMIRHLEICLTNLNA